MIGEVTVSCIPMLNHCLMSYRGGFGLMSDVIKCSIFGALLSQVSCSLNEI